MPVFTFQDPETGREIDIEGEVAPSDAELQEIFAGLPAQVAQDASQVEQNQITAKQETTQLETVSKQPEILKTAGVNEPGGFLDSVSSSLRNFNRSAANLATFGVSDFVAGVGSVLAGGDFATPGQERRQFEADNPKTAIAASIAGGFVNPISKAVGPLIAGGKGLGSKILRGSLGGGGLAGTQGVGEGAVESIGETVEGREVNVGEKIGQAGEMAVLGAAFGGLLPLGAQAGRFAFNGIINLLERFSGKVAGTKALRKVLEALERDGYTPEQAIKRVDELGPEAALLDAGPNTRALGFTTKALPGKGKKKIEQFLIERQEGTRNAKGELVGGQGQRIENSIEELIPDNFFTQQQRLSNINDSAKLYKSAYAANQNVESTNIDRILKTPDGQEAFKLARRTLNNNRENLSKVDPELTELLKEAGEKATGKGVGRGLKLRFLDQVKRELFDLEEAAKIPRTGKSTERSRSITNLRRDLTDELDNIDNTAPGLKGGDYSEARLLAGDKLANQEALELGQKFMSKAEFSNPEALGVALENMSPEARHLFRVGAAQGLKEKIADLVIRADATKKILDIRSLEKKIQSAFGDEDLFRNYTRLMTTEKELFRAVTDVLGNSKTAERGASLDDVAIDPGRIIQGVRDLFSPGVSSTFQGIRNIAGGVSDAIQVSPQESAELARILTGRGGKELFKKALIPKLTRDGGGRSVEELLIRSLAASTGGIDALFE